MSEEKIHGTPERHFIDVRDSLPELLRNNFTLNVIGLTWTKLGDEFQDLMDEAKSMTLSWTKAHPDEQEYLWDIYCGPRGIVYLTKVTARDHDEAIRIAKEKIQAAGIHAVRRETGPEDDYYGQP